jgi:type IV pilus assembly protein PilV
MSMQSQRGISLIEVLVAIFLTMVGLMGVMGVQVFSQRQATTSGQRSIVVQSTEMIMERMRGNITGAECGFYLQAPLNLPGCTAGSAAQQRATADLMDWQQTVANRLPDVVMNIVGGVQAGQILLSVRWTEKESTGLDPACPNGSPANLRCFNTTFMP